MSDIELNLNKATPCMHTGITEGAKPPSPPDDGQEGKKKSLQRKERKIVRLSESEDAALDVWMQSTGKTFADFVRLHLSYSQNMANLSLNLLALLARIEAHLGDIARDTNPNKNSLEILEHLLVIERLCRRLMRP